METIIKKIIANIHLNPVTNIFLLVLIIILIIHIFLIYRNRKYEYSEIGHFKFFVIGVFIVTISTPILVPVGDVNIIVPILLFILTAVFFRAFELYEY